MFLGSGNFVNADKNDFDVLIVDEAHRLREKSGFYGTNGDNQIKELINASYFTIFFIDEDQRVRIEDIGSIDEIKKHANDANATIVEMKLESQFRCNGSDGYISWLNNTLEIKQTANIDFKDFNYDFRVFDNPTDLRDAIINKNNDNKARIVAGYCWDWIEGKKGDTNVKDIKIGDFEMSWNLDSTNTWAIDANSVNEAGCIHTCQGLEFDYVGVIIGPDLRYENGHIITDYKKRAKVDQNKSLKGIVSLEKKDKIKAHDIADTIIKNTYRTLMTRGMKGCYIYCVDPELAKYFKSKI